MCIRDSSGGFWGIEASNGRQYQPINGIPPQFRQKGLSVQAELTPTSGMSIFMWGEQVTLKNISKI